MASPSLRLDRLSGAVTFHTEHKTLSRKYTVVICAHPTRVQSALNDVIAEDAAWDRMGILREVCIVFVASSGLLQFAMNEPYY